MRIKLNFFKVRKFVLAIFVLGLTFAGGYFLGVKGYKAEVDRALRVKVSREVPPDKNVDFSLFWNVWDTLSEKYYDKSKLVPAEMVYGAIQGLTSSLGDPYTMFLSPKENKVVDEDLSGSFEGVGIQIGYRKTRLAVISPLPDSPAEKAGIKPGDYIIHIKDEKKGIDMDTGEISLPEAVQAIRGPAGTKVTLTLVREGADEPVIVEVARVKLDVASVTLKFIGEGESVAHLKVSKFSGDTLKEWDDAVSQILQKPSARLVIVDVRSNPGGYLQGAVDLASEFLPVNTVVVKEEHGDGTKIEYRSEKIGKLQKYKVVVLINGGSASASEILAGALRDDRGFKLVGEKSFGKGTIQEPVEIPGGSGLHVTTAKWLTPDGIWVHEKGLEPDVKIVDDEKTIEDEQLNKALEILNSNP